MTNYVIIVAGGVGSRMKSNIPKQFIELNGRPVIVHTIERFLEWNSNVQVIVVVHSDYISNWLEVKDEYFPSVAIQHTKGGETRFHSVKNGLELVKRRGVIGVHDAARPLVSKNVIEECFKAAGRMDNVIPVVPVHESIRRISNSGSCHVNRKDFVMVQTPQCFNSGILQEAYQQKFNEKFTDDASVVEELGEVIHLVQGNRENIKITEPADILIAEALIQK